MVWIISTMTCLNGIWCVNEVLRRTSFREFECKFISRDNLWIAVRCWRGSVHVKFFFEFWLRSRSPSWTSFFFTFCLALLLFFYDCTWWLAKNFVSNSGQITIMWASFSPLLLLIIVIVYCWSYGYSRCKIFWTTHRATGLSSSSENVKIHVQFSSLLNWPIKRCNTTLYSKATIITGLYPRQNSGWMSE